MTSLYFLTGDYFDKGLSSEEAFGREVWIAC